MTKIEAQYDEYGSFVNTQDDEHRHVEDLSETSRNAMDPSATPQDEILKSSSMTNTLRGFAYYTGLISSNKIALIITKNSASAYIPSSAVYLASTIYKSSFDLTSGKSFAEVYSNLPTVFEALKATNCAALGYSLSSYVPGVASFVVYISTDMTCNSVIQAIRDYQSTQISTEVVGDSGNILDY